MNNIINEITSNGVNQINRNKNSVNKNLVNNSIKTNVTYEWDVKNSEITIHFGKNGLGLTDEFEIIGKFIKRLSKTSFVYIKEAVIDTLDDVYHITIHYIKI